MQSHRKHGEGNWTPPKEHSDFPVTNPKEMEICKLPGKERKTQEAPGGRHPWGLEDAR